MNDNSVPLCVDFHGALTPVNAEHEQLLGLIKNAPRKLFKSHFWGQAEKQGAIDAAALPRRTELIEWLREQRSGGRHIVLLVDRAFNTAEHLAVELDLFDEITHTDDASGSAVQRKHDALMKRYGERGFDFVSGNTDDGLIWSASRRVIVVGGQALRERAGRRADLARVFTTPRPSLATWIRAVRLHQWAKNALIFLPVMLAHSLFAPAVIGAALLGFLSFGLCASSVYILNDLFDLAADRRHPSKRHRPFAAGLLSVRAGITASVLLLLASAAIAAAVNEEFALVLAGYYVVTWAYSVRLKRVAVLDVMILAALYTIRIIAGAAATSVPLSFWLLAFSVFIFLSLGFVKRYAELEATRRTERQGASGRGYGADDLPLIMSLGTTSGYCSIVVMALYINSSDSQALYHHHKPLWLICPLMLFWISRVWMLTARGLMHDDPVVFALRDRISLLILGLLGLIVAASI